MPRPRRSLTGSYFGQKILVATSLIKWYLEHGLEVTRIYQVVQYTPVPCSTPFDEAVSNARRDGDREVNKGNNRRRNEIGRRARHDFLCFVS